MSKQEQGHSDRYLARLRTKLTRPLFVAFGLLFLALGIIGYVLPGLPGTIWLIISAWFFLRSSDRLYKFVVRNKFFGRQVREFLETGEMPRKAKVMALSFIWASSILSIVIAPYNYLFKTIVFSLAIAGTIYIMTRPSSKP